MALRHSGGRYSSYRLRPDYETGYTRPQELQRRNRRKRGNILGTNAHLVDESLKLIDRRRDIATVESVNRGIQLGDQGIVLALI